MIVPSRVAGCNLRGTVQNVLPHLHMKILSRVFSAAVLGLLVLAAGIVFSVRSQEQSMKAQLQAVFTAYGEVVQPALNQLSTMQLTAEERQLLDRARGMITAQLPTNLEEGVPFVSNLQQTLRSLTVSLASHEELAQDSGLAVLKTETSAQGITALALHAFNERVLAWNQRDRSTVGKWIGSILGLEKVMMLNPDGRTEVMPTITL